MGESGTTGVGGYKSKIRNPMVGLHYCSKPNKGIGFIAATKY
jgi:hypothetical protein